MEWLVTKELLALPKGIKTHLSSLGKRPSARFLKGLISQFMTIVWTIFGPCLPYR